MKVIFLKSRMQFITVQTNIHYFAIKTKSYMAFEDLGAQRISSVDSLKSPLCSMDLQESHNVPKNPLQLIKTY